MHACTRAPRARTLAGPGMHVGSTRLISSRTVYQHLPNDAHAAAQGSGTCTRFAMRLAPSTPAHVNRTLVWVVLALVRVPGRSRGGCFQPCPAVPCAPGLHVRPRVRKQATWHAARALSAGGDPALTATAAPRASMGPARHHDNHGTPSADRSRAAKITRARTSRRARGRHATPPAAARRWPFGVHEVVGAGRHLLTGRMSIWATYQDRDGGGCINVGCDALAIRNSIVVNVHALQVSLFNG